MRKKLFTIVMSVMMVAVFMPSMAFATNPTPATPLTHQQHVDGAHNAWVVNDVQFNADYSKATGTVICATDNCVETLGTVTVPTVRAIDANGYVQVSVEAGTLAAAAKAKWDSYSADTFTEGTLPTASYVDLNGATINIAEDDDGAVAPSFYLGAVLAENTSVTPVVPAQLDQTILHATVSVKVQAYDTAYDATTPAYKELSLTNFDLVLLPTAYKAYMAPGKYDVPFTLASKQAVAGTDDVKVFNADKMDKKLQLDIGHPEALGFAEADVTLDGHAFAGLASDVPYNGQAHQFKVEAQNCKVEYDWAAVTPVTVAEHVWSTTAPSFTNAGNYNVWVKMTYTGNVLNSEAKEVTTVEPYVVKVLPREVTFNQAQTDVTVGEHYDIQFKDFMAVAGVVPAEYDQFVELLDKYCVTAKPAMVGSGNVYFDEGVLAAPAGKLASEIAFLSNYTIVDNGQETLAVTVQETKDNVFTQVYKGVNAKKGVKKTVQLKTKGAKGAVTWKKLSGTSKVTVSADGKLVVKKGLKKGTYKVKVKATAAGDYLYGEGSVTKVLKVKVK